MNSLRILRIADVVQKTGLKKSTIYRRVRKGEFPKSFRIGGYARTVGWLEEDIDEYIRKSAPWEGEDERHEAPSHAKEGQV